MGTIRCTLFIFLFAFGPLAGTAQNRYIVHFKDKDGTPFSLQSPGQFLSQRAIDRRQRLNISITKDDFPVNPSYIQQLRLAGISVYFTSRWKNCALIQANASAVPLISGLACVANVERVAQGAGLPGGRYKKFRSKLESGIAAATQAQLGMIGLDAMHEEEILGGGILVALFDSGFQGVNTAVPFQHLFTGNRMAATFDFVGNSDNVFRYDNHGTQVLSVIAGYSSTFTGGAYEASFQLYVTEDVGSEYRVEEYNWLFAAERADSAGVDVISSSLGYNLFDDPIMNYTAASLDGKTAVVSFAAAESIKRGIVVVCSAGNEGNNSWGFITPPADVNGILAVGSVTNSGAKSTFSSRGPTADNRIKPDVMAMGSGTSVVNPQGVTVTLSGTSVAAPIITSLVVGLRQKFPDLSVSQIYQAVIGSASQFKTPDNLLGYGIPNYSLALDLIAEPISVFPNPLDDGRFKIFLRSGNQDVDLVVYDLQGKKLNEQTIRITSVNNPVEVDLSDLAAGTYLLKLRTKDSSKAVRVIKL